MDTHEAVVGLGGNGEAHAMTSAADDAD
jgi:hypothetical protein